MENNPKQKRNIFSRKDKSEKKKKEKRNQKEQEEEPEKLESSSLSPIVSTQASPSIVSTTSPSIVSTPFSFSSTYPTHNVIWIQEFVSKEKKVAKGDFVYYEWNVDDKKETSALVKVKDPQKVTWPKISKITFHSSIVGNLGKGKDSFEDKFIEIHFWKSEKKESTSGTATPLGGITINLNEYISPIQDEIYFNVKNKKLPLNNQEDTKKKQTIKFTTKTKRGYAGQAFIEGDNDLDLTETSHDFSELSTTTTSIIGKSRFSASGINSSNSSEEDHVIELQVENESLKRQYRELVVKHEKEKRELEHTVKNTIEEKKKIEIQFRELLESKSDSLNGVLMKKIQDLENVLKETVLEKNEVKEQLKKVTMEYDLELEKFRVQCSLLQATNTAQKEKIAEFSENLQNSEIFSSETDQNSVEENTKKGKKDKKDKISQLKNLNKQIAEQNKKIKKRESELQEKYDRLQKNFDKYKEEATSGKAEKKEVVEENKKLKKSEAEIREKFEKLQKLYEEKNSKAFHKKSEIDGLQSELTDARDKLKQLNLLYDKAQKKLDKYNKRFEKRDEPVVYTEWLDFFVVFNQKLSNQKKDKLSQEESKRVQMAAFILQNLVTMTHSQIIYIYGRNRTMPEELIQECESLKELLKLLEVAKLSLENNNEELVKENKFLNDRAHLLEVENSKLKEELKILAERLPESSDASKQLNVIQNDFDTIMGKIKDLQKQVKEAHGTKVKLEEDMKKSEKKSKKQTTIATNERQQQLDIQDRLLDELKMTTKILNDTLEEKNNWHVFALDLQSKVTLLEKKLESYQEKQDINSEIPCLVVSSMLDILEQYLSLHRDPKVCQNILSTKTQLIQTTTTTTTTTTHIASPLVGTSNPFDEENPFDDGNPFG